MNSKNLLDDEELNLLKLYLALRGISFDQDEPEGIVIVLFIVRKRYN